MKKKSHVQIASYISESKDLIPHTFLFKLGSIMPDIFLFSYIKGHKYSSTSDKTSAILEKLLEKQKWGLLACFRMGYRIHYLADYFTFPHDPAYRGGLRCHNRYEAAMRDHLEAALQKYRGAEIINYKSGELGKWIDSLHTRYTVSTHGIDNDIMFIMKMSDVIYSAIANAALQKNPA